MGNRLEGESSGEVDAMLRAPKAESRGASEETGLGTKSGADQIECVDCGVGIICGALITGLGTECSTTALGTGMCSVSTGYCACDCCAKELARKEGL